MRNNFFSYKVAGAKDVAVLIYEIGIRTNSTYTKESIDENGKIIGALTITTTGNMVNGLRAMGYVVPGSFSDYDFSKVKSSIIAGKPVIAYGQSGYGGHFWVIDGVRKMTYTEYLADGSWGLWNGWDFVYCNIGSSPDSRSNAWYLSGLFYMGKGYQSHVSRSNDDDFFQYKMNILPNVY